MRHTLIVPLNPCSNTILTSSPANAEAASLYRENMKEYVRRVKLTVEQSWIDETEDAHDTNE